MSGNLKNTSLKVEGDILIKKELLNWPLNNIYGDVIADDVEKNGEDANAENGDITNVDDADIDNGENVIVEDVNEDNGVEDIMGDG